MKISSPAFEAGGEIPIKYTCQGENIFLPLDWDFLPDGTESLALKKQNYSERTSGVERPPARWVECKKGENLYQTTEVNKPPMKTSDEAKQEQLEMSREQGQAYKKALEHMAKDEAHGETMPAGNYLVSYAVEAAEGMYHLMDAGLVWHEPQHENAHIEIAVQDGSDLRFIPGLTVYVTVLDLDDNEIGTHQQPFLWHPWLYHYGRNWELPGDGEYTIRVHIDAPDFMRHDKENGKRYADPVDVEFSNVSIKTGQK